MAFIKLPRNINGDDDNQQNRTKSNIVHIVNHGILGGCRYDTFYNIFIAHCFKQAADGEFNAAIRIRGLILNTMSAIINATYKPVTSLIKVVQEDVLESSMTA